MPYYLSYHNCIVASVLFQKKAIAQFYKSSSPCECNKVVTNIFWHTEFSANLKNTCENTHLRFISSLKSKLKIKQNKTNKQTKNKTKNERKIEHEMEWESQGSVKRNGKQNK